MASIQNTLATCWPVRKLRNNIAVVWQPPSKP